MRTQSSMFSTSQYHFSHQMSKKCTQFSHLPLSLPESKVYRRPCCKQCLWNGVSSYQSASSQHGHWFVQLNISFRTHLTGTTQWSQFRVVPLQESDINLIDLPTCFHPPLLQQLGFLLSWFLLLLRNKETCYCRPRKRDIGFFHLQWRHLSQNDKAVRSCHTHCKTRMLTHQHTKFGSLWAMAQEEWHIIFTIHLLSSINVLHLMGHQMRRRRT